MAINKMANSESGKSRVSLGENDATTRVFRKSFKLLEFLYERPEGVRADYLEKYLDIPQRTLYNRLKKLEQAGLVENIYPIWRIAKNQAGSQKVANLLASGKDIQAHKFSFTLQLINKPTWWEKRENKLIRLKEFQYKAVEFGNCPYQQIGRDYFLVQTFATSIVFINQKRYWNNDPYGAFSEALQDTLEMLRFIEERFRFKFYADGVPQFSVSSQHFVKIRDAVAQHCKKVGRGFNIEIDGKLRGWVDMSDPVGMEFGHKNYAPEDTQRHKKLVEDVIVNNPPLPSEQWKRIEELQQVVGQSVQTLNKAIESEVMYGEHHRSHVATMQTLGKSVGELTGIIKDMRNVQVTQSQAITALASSIKEMQIMFKEMKERI